MRVLVIVAAAFVSVLSYSALAWQDSAPGGERWPQIPGNRGIESFYGHWQPDCRDAVWSDQGEIIIEPDGVLRYTAKEPYFPTQYRIIETTPYGVTLMVRTPARGKYHERYKIWVLRYLRESWRAKEPYKAGVNTCFPTDLHLKDAGFRWDLSDDELKAFWDKFSPCNPALTRKYPEIKDAGVQYWGDGWSQGCELIRLTDP